MPKATDRKLANLRFKTPKGQNSWDLKCDVLAVREDNRHLRGDHIMIASIAGPATSVKAAHAILATPGGHASLTDCSDLLGRHFFGFGVWRDGYVFRKHQIRDKWWHMIAMAKTPDLLLDFSEAAFYHRLRSDDFTTPLLRSWTPWLLEQCLKNELLIKLKCFQCEAAMLHLEDCQLDELVTKGLKSGQLKVKE